MFASVSRVRSIARFCGRCSWQRGPRDDIGPLGSSHIGGGEAGRLPARNGLVGDASDGHIARRSVLRRFVCVPLQAKRSSQNPRLTGLVLYSKRLEMGRFTWPAIQDGVITLTASQLSVLLDGLDWRKVAPRAVDRPLRAGANLLAIHAIFE